MEREDEMSDYWTEADLRNAVLRMHGPQAPQASVGPVGSQRHDATPIDEPEASFQARILRLAKQHGWLCHHSHDSRRNEWGCDAGLPDLILVRDAVLFAELKTRTGKLTAEQERWLTMLSRAGQETYIWRPADWPFIEERLTQPWRRTP